MLMDTDIMVPGDEVEWTERGQGAVRFCFAGTVTAVNFPRDGREVVYTIEVDEKPLTRTEAQLGGYTCWEGDDPDARADALALTLRRWDLARAAKEQLRLPGLRVPKNRHALALA